MATSTRGLPLSTHKHLTVAGALACAATPSKLVLPLDQHAETLLEPCVAVGDSVMLGQVIARSQQRFGAWLHASASGTVQAIERRTTAQHQQQAVTVIVLSNDGRDAVDRTLTAFPDWQHHSPLELCEQLARGGIVGLGGAVFSAATKLAEGDTHRIEHLLINGMECEPYIDCDAHLMQERAAEIVQGVQILMHACDTQLASVAIENDKPEAIRAMQSALTALRDSRIKIVSLPTAYPSGDEGQLITQLLAKEIPRGGLPADIGVIVQNVGTAYASAQWILQARPLISRIVTVTGHGVTTPRNLEVRIGTSCADLIGECNGYSEDISSLIMGGPMMGSALLHDDYPVVKATNCLLAGATRELRSPPAEMPCIRCGECSSVCPVYLLPQQLFMHLRRGDSAAASELGLFDCIECGCCDFVCPSQLILATRFRDAKRKLKPTLAMPPA